MRKLLTITCCVGIASLVGAAQNNNQDNNNPQNKKKGGGNAPQQQQQVVAPQTGKKFKAGPGAGPHHNQNFQQSPNVNAQNPNTVGNLNKGKKGKWQGQTQTSANANVNTGGNVSGNAANTKFNKSKKFGQGNVAGGGNMKFQKKHFNLQTNNKQLVVNKYKTVNFNANYKIQGAHNWKGSKYQVFVNYHPQ